MADITTNLDKRPYFDDYAEAKKFYRVLYKPGTAVQARELTQMQTIMQKQISRFGSHVFKNGSVVDGVKPDFVRGANVLRVKNSYANGSQITIDDITSYGNNLVVESQTSDLSARLFHAQDGSEAAKPDTKRMYITYEGADLSQTRTSTGTLSLTAASNTVTGTATAFTNYSVGDVVSIWETAARGRTVYTATVASIANNTSMDLSRALTFSNSSIADTNYEVSQELSKFGQLGTDASPEVVDLVDYRILNEQSAVVNTSISATDITLGFVSSDSNLLEVEVNGELQTLTTNYTANSSTIVFTEDLANGDEVEIIQRERTVAFAGVRCFSDSLSSTVASEEAVVARNEEGVIYHKGQFLNIEAGFSVISDNLAGANNAQVVVNSDESVVTYKSDTSLLDNAAGFANDSAPGADRLKIDPSLKSVNTSTVSNESAAATLLEFNEEGDLRIQNDDPQYAELGRQLAIRTNDHAGSYTVKRFPVSTRATSNNQTVDIIAGAGVGYVDGYRIETLADTFLEMNRGILTESFDNQELIINQSNRIRVSGIVGHPQPGLQLNFFKVTSGGGAFGAFADNDSFVTYTGVTSAADAVPATCTKVGDAVIAAIDYVSGTPGTEACVWDIAVFNVNVTAGQDITTARSVGLRRDSDATVGLAANVTFAADIVLDDNNLATLHDTTTLPFASYGATNLKTYRDSLNAIDNNSRVRYALNVTDSFSTLGTMSIDIDDDSRMTYGTKNVGAITDDELNNIVISNVGTEITSTGASATATNFDIAVDAADASEINIGDTLQIDAGAETTVTAINGTTITVDVDLGSSTGTLKKVLQVGKVLNLTPSMVSTDQVNNTIDITYPPLSGGSWSASTTVLSIVDADAVNVEESTLTISKDNYWVFNTNSATNENIGPWPLAGAVNVHKITGVYIVPNGPANASNTSVVEGDLAGLKNYADGGFFQMDSGQRDYHVGEGALELTNKGLRRNILNDDSTIIVVADVLETDIASGAGYVTIDSYPTTTESTANSSTILLAEVPSYIATSGQQTDLRNVIDYRPYMSGDLTGHDTLVNAQSNVNDASSATDKNTNQRFSFAHNTELTSDYTSYKTARVDVYVEPSNQLAVSRVESANQQPASIPGSLRVATIGIPAFPSLTPAEARAIGDTKTGGRTGSRNTIFNVNDRTMNIEQFNIRGYTMKDIGALAQRIDNLEYYSSMNSLENDVFNKQLKNDSGIERFKNGFFVDPLNSHQFGQTDNGEYAVSIDKQRGAMVPVQDAEYVSEYDPSIISGSVDRYGPQVMFDHTETELMKQDRATKVRPAAPVAIRFIGDVRLFPTYDAGVDNNLNEIIVNPDDQPPVQEGVVRQAGPWRTTDVTRDVDTARARRVRTVTTRTQQQRTTTLIGVNVTESVETIPGTEKLVDISLNPFIREQVISFSARGLRPSTQHHVFFNRQNVDEHVRPGGLMQALPHPLDLIIRPADKDELNDGARRVTLGLGEYGTPIRTSSQGTLRGAFRVPAGTFLQGDREFLIADVEDLRTEEDSILSSGAAVFHSNRIGAEKTIDAERNFEVTREIIGTETERRTLTERVQSAIPRDPIAQSFTVPSDGKSKHIFVSSLDVFFRTRGKNRVGVYICPMAFGQPDTTRILSGSKKSLPAAKVQTSEDGSAATTFTFKHPIRLDAGESYAFVIKPELDDPDYDVYFAELGGTDLITGRAVNSQPIGGIAFLGANEQSWSKLQDEDIKFTLRRAVFATGTGVVRFEPEAKDFMKFEDFVFLNSNVEVRVGDYVFGMDSATSDPAVTSANIDNTMFGIVQAVDAIDQIMTVAPSTGGWTSSAMTTFSETLRDGTTRNTDKYKVAIYRPRDEMTELTTIDDTRFVASSFVEMYDHEFSTIHTGWNVREFKDSTVALEMTYNGANTVSRSFDLPIEGEIDYTKKTLKYRSYSNDLVELGSATTGRSYYITATMTNNDPYTTPYIDLRRTDTTLAGWETIAKDENATNFITGATVDVEADASIYSEMFKAAGEANNRYISKTVTLADGQDAEDIKMYLSAFRPPKSDIAVFIRAAQAYENINDKLFTPLKLETPDVYSNRDDFGDIVELEYGFYTRTELDATTFPDAFAATSGQYAHEFTKNFTANSMIALNNSGVAEYESGGATYTTYKTYEVKIVLYSNGAGSDSNFGTTRTPNPPMVYDVRSIALQV